MRVEYFIQDMIDMINMVDREVLLNSCNLDKYSKIDI